MSSDFSFSDFERRCSILGDLWINYRDTEQFADFVEYNDLGLPLAYAVSAKIIESSPLAEKFIGETYDLLLAGLGLDDDEYLGIDEMLDSASPPDKE